MLRIKIVKFRFCVLCHTAVFSPLIHCRVIRHTVVFVVVPILHCSVLSYKIPSFFILFHYSTAAAVFSASFFFVYTTLLLRLHAIQSSFLFLFPLHHCCVLSYTVHSFVCFFNGLWCGVVDSNSASVDVFIGGSADGVEYTSVPYSRTEKPSTDEFLESTAMVSGVFW